MNAEQQQLVQDIETRESKLTDWERNFIDSIQSQALKGIPLSTKQTECLNRIWERVT